MRRVFAGRNISSHRELDYSLTNLLPFDKLKNIGAAAGLLIDAIRADKRILIVADYDADGATACAVALRGLSMLGARQAVYMVPDRVKQGYGLSTDVARQALEFDPDLLVTVDNGISSMAGIDFARSAGVDVLVTDHHLPGRELPAASVIVNPNQPGDRFPSKCIAGVGVMFYVLLAVRAGLKQAGWFAAQGIEAPNFAALLDLVALGTVADVVQLDYNNRILVYQGLRRIRARALLPGHHGPGPGCRQGAREYYCRRPRVPAGSEAECGRPHGRHETGHRMPAHGQFFRYGCPGAATGQIQ